MNFDIHKALDAIKSIFVSPRRKMKIGAIGLTFSSDSMQLIQMEDDGGAPVIRSALSVDYPFPLEKLLSDPESLRKFIGKSLVEGNFVGNKIVSCLIPKDVRHIPIQYRQTDKKSTSYEPFFKELQNHLQEPLSSLVVDVLHVRTPTSDASDRSVIAVVADRQRTINHLELLRMAGLDVIALDSGPAALGRVISDAHYAHHQSSSALIINFGKKNTYLTEIWGRRLMLNREIDFGEDLLIEKICQRLKCNIDTASKLFFNVDFDKAHREEITDIINEILHHELLVLTREIGQSLTYVASLTRGDTAKIIYLMGGVSSYPQIKGIIEAKIQIPVLIYDPSIQFPYRQGIFPLANGMHHLLATATGLALRGLYADGN